MRRGELEHARGLVESSHEIHERTNDRWGQAQTRAREPLELADQLEDRPGRVSAD
jgi:hypothetical protein